MRLLSLKTLSTQCSLPNPTIFQMKITQSDVGAKSVLDLTTPRVSFVPVLVKFLPIAGPCFFLALQCSSAATALQIMRTKTVGKFSIIPFASLFLNCVVWTLYGFLRQDPTVLLPNAMGILVAVFCLFSYHKNSSSSSSQVFAALAASSLAAVFLAKAGLVHLIGLVGCALSVALSGSPLAVIKTVIQDKSTAALPFGTSFLTWLNNFSWLCYGYFAAKDILIYGPNFLGFMLSSIQMLLFVKYGVNKSSGSTEAMEKREML